LSEFFEVPIQYQSVPNSSVEFFMPLVMFVILICMHCICVGWCCSDDEDKNRTPSDKSDTDTSHVEEPAEDEFRESDEDNERVGNGSHGSLTGGLRRRRGSSTTAIVLTVPKQSNYVPSNEEYSSVRLILASYFIFN